MTALNWNNTIVDGRKTAFYDLDGTRLYVAQRRGAFEAWRDGKKLGNYATQEQAMAAAAGQSLPVVNASKPVPKSEPALLNGGYTKPNPGKFTGERPKHKTSAEVALEKYPLADMSEAPLVETRPGIVVGEPRRYDVKADHGRCKCGAGLDRKGRCPALCEPVPAPPPEYTGPKVVGSTHIGKLAAPVTGWTGGRP